MRLKKFEIDYKKLFDMAESFGQEEMLERDLYSLKKLLAKNYEARLFVENNEVPMKMRIDFLEKAFKSESKIFWELVGFLMDSEEQAALSSISDKYSRYLGGRKNKEFAEIIVPFEVEAKTIDMIKKAFNRDISFKVAVDPSILGGFMVKKIDGTIIDASIRGRLEGLKKGMLK